MIEPTFFHHVTPLLKEGGYFPTRQATEFPKGKEGAALASSTKASGVGVDVADDEAASGATSWSRQSM